MQEGGTGTRAGKGFSPPRPPLTRAIQIPHPRTPGKPRTPTQPARRPDPEPAPGYTGLYPHTIPAHTRAYAILLYYTVVYSIILYTTI